MTSVPAAEAPTRSDERTLELLLQRRQPSGVTARADGGGIAFSARGAFAPPNEPTPARVWTNTLRGEAREATREPGSETLPRWSPDGTVLAFASARDTPGRTRVELLAAGAAEPFSCADFAGAIERMQWSRDGRLLLVLVADDGGDADDQDPRVAAPSAGSRSLHLVDTAHRSAERVGPYDACVWEFDWDGEATVVAVVSSDPSENAWYGARLAVIDTATAALRTLYEPTWQIASPRLSADGASAAFIEGLCTDRGALVGTAKVVRLDGTAPLELAPEADVSALAWRDASRLWYAGPRGLASTCGSLTLDGEVEELWAGDATISSFDASADGLLATKETLDEPPEVAILDPRGTATGWRPLSSLNRDLAGIEPHRCEGIAWNAADGLEIEGILVRPRDAGETATPLVVMVHGGPVGRWSYRFPSGAPHAHLLADAGYTVLLPNPRGSTGRGHAFAHAVVSDLGGAELGDILSGVDACVRAGHVDDRRVGIMGASHGGFMAAWAVTQTDRFRASIALACASNYLSLHYTSTIGALDDILFAGADPVPAYVERSPVAHARKCSTPTLILHGERDPFCPPGQAQELYQALLETGVETELVLYPREGHGWIEREHQIDLWRRIRDWFGQHLLEATVSS